MKPWVKLLPWFIVEAMQRGFRFIDRTETTQYDLANLELRVSHLEKQAQPNKKAAKNGN